MRCPNDTQGIASHDVGSPTAVLNGKEVVYCWTCMKWVEVGGGEVTYRFKYLCPDCGKRDQWNHWCRTTVPPEQRLRGRTPKEPRKAPKKKRVYAARPEEAKQEIAMLYKSGCTMEEIGKELGISRERVRQILASQGVTGKLHKEWRREALTDADSRIFQAMHIKKEKREIVSMMRQGYRERLVSRVVAELAEDLGRPPVYSEVSEALGLGFGFKPQQVGAYLSSYLSAHVRNGERFEVATDRIWKRAGVAKRRVGGAGHRVKGLGARTREFCLSGQHRMSETARVHTWGGKTFRQCTVCKREKARIRYEAKVRKNRLLAARAS